MIGEVVAANGEVIATSRAALVVSRLAAKNRRERKMSALDAARCRARASAGSSPRPRATSAAADVGGVQHVAGVQGAAVMVANATLGVSRVEVPRASTAIGVIGAIGVILEDRVAVRANSRGDVTSALR